MALTCWVGCGPDETGVGEWDVEEGPGDESGYDEDSTVIVDTDPETEDYVVTGDGEGCVQVGDDCVDPATAREEARDDNCEDSDARADVIVDDGEVVDVICYPPEDEETTVENVGETDGESGDTEIPQTENGSVLTFDDSTDGEPIEGDVAIESERTTLYGNGVDTTILGGNLTVASNNSRVRSLTVQGDVTYEDASNDSSLAFCKIHGNLDVVSNNFKAMNCKVFGDVSVSGNGATLINVGVGGEWDVNSNADCRGCYSFDDENDDSTVQDDEIGDELTCEEGG